MNGKLTRIAIHLLLIITMLSLFAVGCDQETAKESPSPTPAKTQTTVPTWSSLPTPTQGTPTLTPAEEPGSTASPTPQSAYPDEAPQLPPSFGLDENVFGSLPDIMPSSEPLAQGAVMASINGPLRMIPPSRSALGDQSHWNHAAGNVLIWSVVIVVGLAVPVAAFAASFNNIPYRADAATWIWSYDVNIGNKKHSAELHGTYVPNGVEWEMYISKEGEYEKFKWYYGESNMAGTEGYWIMKEKPEDPNDLLQIDWQRDPAAGTNEIKYENIKPGGPEKGGYIITRITGETPYDASWDIYNKGKNNHTYIEWNRETEQGRVKDSHRFGDNIWHCWDSDHKNRDC